MTDVPSAQERDEAIAIRVADFAASTDADRIPEAVLERARYLILDSVGLAFASATYPFAGIAREALGKLGTGDHPALGMPDRLEARDAAILNGVLVHGLDFDDTHIPAVTHVSAAALPAALAAGIAAGSTDRELLAAYVLGIEVSARVGMAGAGGFHDVGWHPTAVAGAFGSAVAAGKLLGLDAHGLAAAQGIVGSMSAGLLEFLADGAWTKRLHPGWAAMSGLTAATFSQSGWSGPPAVYEGRFGLFATHLAGRESFPQRIAEGLGAEWELINTAVKPYPVCHFIHAFADAALTLREQHGIRVEDIAEVRCRIHPTPGKVVSEPAANKWEPRDEYDAKFSLPYVVATILARGQFSLNELSDAALADTEVLELARKVSVGDDEGSAFPHAYSGAVEVELRDGRVLAHREQVNRGHAERPLTNADIDKKFTESMALATDETTTERVRAAVLRLGQGGSARAFADACSVSA